MTELSELRGQVKMLQAQLDWEQMAGTDEPKDKDAALLYLRRMRRIERNFTEDLYRLEKEKCELLDGKLEKARKAVSLLNSMVAGGEQHSEQSRKMVSEALS